MINNIWQSKTTMNESKTQVLHKKHRKWQHHERWGCRDQWAAVLKIHKKRRKIKQKVGTYLSGPIKKKNKDRKYFILFQNKTGYGKLKSPNCGTLIVMCRWHETNLSTHNRLSVADRRGKTSREEWGELESDVTREGGRQECQWEEMAGRKSHRGRKIMWH